MNAHEAVETDQNQNGPFDSVATDATSGGVIGAVGGAIIGGIAGGPPGAFMGAAIGAGVTAVAVDYMAFEDAEADMAPEHQPTGSAAFKRPTGHDPVSDVHPIEGSPADALFPTEEYNELIRQRAFENWNRRGCPTGTAEEDWREAKRQIDLRHGVSDMANYGGPPSRH